MIALGLCLTTGPAAADVLSMPEGDPIPQVVMPAKGLTMAEVEKRFGPPRAKQPTVGGGSARQPPITRWDYDAFVVVFERDKVIDAVVPGAPPELHNKDALQPVVEAVTPPAEAVVPAEPPVEGALAPDEMAPAPEGSAPAEPAADEMLPAEPEAPPATPEPVHPTVREIPADTPPTPR